MNISFVRHSLLNRGGDKMIVAYASYLAAAGHNVVIRTNLRNTVFEPDPRITFKSLKYPGKVGTVISLFLEVEDADIIIADIIPLALFLTARNRNKVVYFAQDYNENVYSTLIQKLFIRLLYAVSFALIKIPVIAVSADLSRSFTARFRVEPTVICNGVDLKIFYPEADETLLQQKGDKKAVLFFSRRDYRKGFDLALATVAAIIESALVPIEVWAVGELLDNDEVKCSHRDFGYVNEAMLRRIMSSADLFLYPSRNEGFPLMVMEAFACRCPVVTTTAIPYAVDGENALVADIGDVAALTEKSLCVLTDKELTADLTDRAANFATNYSLEVSAFKFMRYLEKRAVRANETCSCP